MLNLENKLYQLFLKVLYPLPVSLTYVMTTFFLLVYIASTHEITDLRKTPVIYVTNADNAGSKLQMFPAPHMWVTQVSQQKDCIIHQGDKESRDDSIDRDICPAPLVCLKLLFVLL